MIAPNYRRRLGQLGEKLARQFLQRRDYQIVGQNYQTRHGEIDLIAQKAGRLFFIEVKTRANNRFGWPEEAVTSDKLVKLKLTARQYLLENNLPGNNAQLDVISIEIDRATKRARIKHWPNVT